MSGGTLPHSVICINLYYLLRSRLGGSSCRAYDKDVRIRAGDAYAYPDASVVCGALQMDADEPKRTVANPRVLFEVLSPSTEADDRGDKFLAYREIEALQEYVLVSQDVPRVERFIRDAGGVWLIVKPTEGLDAVAELKSVEIELPLCELYDGVVFPSLPEGPTRVGG